jgi:hypothetical protein
MSIEKTYGVVEGVPTVTLWFTVGRRWCLALTWRE